MEARNALLKGHCMLAHTNSINAKVAKFTLVRQVSNNDRSNVLRNSDSNANLKLRKACRIFEFHRNLQERTKVRIELDSLGSVGLRLSEELKKRFCI